MKFKINDKVDYMVGDKVGYSGVIVDIAKWDDVNGTGSDPCYKMTNKSGYTSWYGANLLTSTLSQAQRAESIPMRENILEQSR